MKSLPDSMPYSVKVSFFMHQRREWEKVLESSKSINLGDDRSECLQHWESVNSYAVAKIQEIDRKIEALKLALAPSLSAATSNI